MPKSFVKWCAWKRGRGKGPRSALERARHEPTHVVPLEDEEQHDARQGEDDDAGLGRAVVDDAHHLLPHVRDGQRERVHVRDRLDR